MKPLQNKSSSQPDELQMVFFRLSALYLCVSEDEHEIFSNQSGYFLPFFARRCRGRGKNIGELSKYNLCASASMNLIRSEGEKIKRKILRMT